jgi:hypothetical protein
MSISVDGLFRYRRAISDSLKKWLKSPEGDLYTHITIILLSVVAICTAHISKNSSWQYLKKNTIKKYIIRNIHTNTTLLESTS